MFCHTFWTVSEESSHDTDKSDKNEFFKAIMLLDGNRAGAVKLTMIELAN